MFYKPLLVLDQAGKVLTRCISCIWIGIGLLFCESVAVSNDINYYTLRIVMAMMLIGWWVSAYTFCGHPTSTSLLFLLGGFLSLINLFSIKPKIRASIPSGFSSLGYGNMLMIDITHLGELHISHFSGHLILFLVAIYIFLSLDPLIKFVKCNHQRIIIADAVGHLNMSILEPVYLILAVQNLIEYFEHRK